MIFPRSCADFKNSDPKASSGRYVIDPDGEKGLSPFTVYCDMNDKNGVGVTVISHDNEDRTLVMKIQAATHVTFITQERVCLSLRVLPESLYTVNRLSNMSVMDRYCFSTAFHLDGGCHVVIIR